MRPIKPFLDAPSRQHMINVAASGDETKAQHLSMLSTPALVAYYANEAKDRLKEPGEKRLWLAAQGRVKTLLFQASITPDSQDADQMREMAARWQQIVNAVKP